MTVRTQKDNKKIIYVEKNIGVFYIHFKSLILTCAHVSSVRRVDLERERERERESFIILLIQAHVYTESIVLGRERGKQNRTSYVF